MKILPVNQSPIARVYNNIAFPLSIMFAEGDRLLPYFLNTHIQVHGPIESRYFSVFFVLSVQVLVPSQGQELVPIAVKNKNLVRLPIR